MTEDLVLELSERIRKMVNQAQEDGVRAGIESVGRGDLRRLVDKLKASEEKAWKLVESVDATVDGFIEAILGAQEPDAPGRKEKFMAWCKAQDEARNALAARKAGQ